MKTRKIKALLKKAYYYLLYHSYNMVVLWLDKSIFEELNRYDNNARILNLGSGVGRFDKYIKVDMINMDIDGENSPQVVADAHFMPFADESFDCVFSNAVLEHVLRPWEVASEMRRVLKRGGKVCVNVPFLGVFHEQHDYFRFTLDGLKSLFPDFKEVKSGVSAGPFSFVTVFISSYLSSAFSGRRRDIMTIFVNFIVFPLKYIDVIVKKKDMKEFADAVYFIGAKE